MPNNWTDRYLKPLLIPLWPKLMFLLGTFCLATAWIGENLYVDPAKDEALKAKRRIDDIVNRLPLLDLDQNAAINVQLNFPRKDSLAYVSSRANSLHAWAQTLLAGKWDLLRIKSDSDNAHNDSVLINEDSDSIEFAAADTCIPSLLSSINYLQKYAKDNVPAMSVKATNKRKILEDEINRWHHWTITLIIAGAILLNLDKAREFYLNRKSKFKT